MIRKISTIVVVICILILSLVGCSKGTVTKVSPTPEASKVVSLNCGDMEILQGRS